MYMSEMNSWIQTIQQVYCYWNKDEIMAKPVKVVYNIYMYCKNVLARRAKLEYVEYNGESKYNGLNVDEYGMHYDSTGELVD